MNQTVTVVAVKKRRQNTRWHRPNLSHFLDKLYFIQIWLLQNKGSHSQSLWYLSLFLSASIIGIGTLYSGIWGKYIGAFNNAYTAVTMSDNSAQLTQSRRDVYSSNRTFMKNVSVHEECDQRKVCYRSTLWFWCIYSARATDSGGQLFCCSAQCSVCDEEEPCVNSGWCDTVWVTAQDRGETRERRRLVTDTHTHRNIQSLRHTLIETRTQTLKVISADLEIPCGVLASMQLQLSWYLTFSTHLNHFWHFNRSFTQLFLLLPFSCFSCCL